MATVPTLRTWTDAEVITHTMMNENLRDVTEFLVNDKPHGFARQLISTTSIANATWTSVVWDFEDVDTDGGFASPTASVYTVQTAGFYMVSGHLNWNNNSTSGIRAARITKNGVMISAAYNATPATTVATGNMITVMEHFAVNDTIALQGWQSSGVNVSTNLNYTNFRNETSFLDVAWWGKQQ